MIEYIKNLIITVGKYKKDKEYLRGYNWVCKELSKGTPTKFFEDSLQMSYDMSRFTHFDSGVKDAISDWKKENCKLKEK